MERPSFPLRSAFLALPLETEALRHFQEAQERLRPFEAALSFQNPRTPHLTLVFWRELLEIEWGPMLRKAAEIADRTAPFTMRVTGAACFGERGEDRVLFLEVAFSPELAVVKKLCPWPDSKPFAPHITIARVRHPERFAVMRKKAFKALDDCTFDVPVDRLCVYADVEGRKQTPLAEFLFTRLTPR